MAIVSGFAAYTCSNLNSLLYGRTRIYIKNVAAFSNDHRGTLIAV